MGERQSGSKTTGQQYTSLTTPEMKEGLCVSVCVSMSAFGVKAMLTLATNLTTVT